MEVLTYQQTITAAIALIAIILSSVSLRRTTRVPELAPGNRIPLWAAITMGMGTTFSGRWTWRNPDGSTETRKSSLAI